MSFSDLYGPIDKMKENLKEGLDWTGRPERINQGGLIGSLCDWDVNLRDP